MSADDVFPKEIVRYGAYVCLRLPDAGDRRALAALAVPALAARLGLRNEFEAVEPLPRAAIAFLRRGEATAGDIADDEVRQADAVIHVASATPAPVAEFCAEVTRLLAPAIKPRILTGVVRPMSYTGNAMNNFAYAHRVLQQPGPLMPNAFLIPMSKTAGWWAKDWMERHTYFLPRYDEEGRMTAEGHALASAAGIPCLLRRTYKHPTEPAPEGAYDFITYFECSDADVPTFHRVVASLRDVTKNPEWRFVREGPMWHGRRVATWPDLFALGS
jgi:hypothetical protein